jgi:hypothetical protein
VLLTDANEAVVRRIPLATDGEPMDDEARRLLTHLQDAPGTALGQLISLLSRLDDLAHVLLWSPRERDCEGRVCLIREIARLRDCGIARLRDCEGQVCLPWNCDAWPLMAVEPL